MTPVSKKLFKVIVVFTIVHIIFGCGSKDKDLKDIVLTMKPLVTAIEEYKEDHAEAPLNLQKLIPEYLPSLPKVDSKYCYSDIEYKQTAISWSIKLKCSQGLLNWDEFIYYPSQKYDNLNVTYKIVDGWAYIYE